MPTTATIQPAILASAVTPNHYDIAAPVAGSGPSATDEVDNNPKTNNEMCKRWRVPTQFF